MKKCGFTILELLVAMAVLAMIMVMMLQVATGILGSTRAQNQQMDSVAAARRILDVMDADVRKAVINDSASILVSQAGPGFALLAQRRGTSATNHRFLAVRYFANASNQLVRAYGTVPFNDPALIQAPVTRTTGAGATEAVMADGILGFQIRIAVPGINPTGFVASTDAPAPNWATNSYNGATTPSGWNALITGAPSFANQLTNRAQTLRVWLVAADPQTMDLLRSANAIGAAQTAITNKPHAKDWRTAIDNANIPNQAKSAIRILNKTLPLP